MENTIGGKTFYSNKDGYAFMLVLSDEDSDDMMEECY